MLALLNTMWRAFLVSVLKLQCFQHAMVNLFPLYRSYHRPAEKCPHPIIRQAERFHKKAHIAMATHPSQVLINRLFEVLSILRFHQLE